MLILLLELLLHVGDLLLLLTNVLLVLVLQQGLLFFKVLHNLRETLLQDLYLGLEQFDLPILILLPLGVLLHSFSIDHHLSLVQLILFIQLLIFLLDLLYQQSLT